tara:strand:- start:5385 stop:6284 length:900 start_codon:yes stop_codon:yes gene_type:complete
MYNIFGFYKFKNIKNLKRKKKLFINLLTQEQFKGTITLSLEGVNGTICFKKKSNNIIKKKIKEILNIKKFDNENLSNYKYQAFHKAKIKIKKELVPIGVNLNKRINHNQVDPKNWNKFMEKKNTILIDTRKNFEFRVGSFKGAINPKLNNFKDFPKFFKTLDKKKDIGMFCTGGIRCEKASFYLKRKGFRNVYQLRGGIINYLKKVDEKKSLWKGDCFVFDNRVSVKHGLLPGNLSICAGCREPISILEKKSPKYEEGVSCSNCFYRLTKHQIERFRMRQKQVNIAKKAGRKFFYQKEI